MALRRLALLAACGAALAAPAAAAASGQTELGIADDKVLFGADQAAAAETVATWKRLGFDSVRVHARWVAHVPEPHATAPPAGFDATDPADPRYNWDRLDHAVALVRGAGLDVMLAVTGSGPLWGTQDPARGSHRHKPDARRFAAFATAVARRYGGQVATYLVWNEPNQPLWLQPQFRCVASARTGRRCIPEAPHVYRRLVAAATPAIKQADPGARVLLGTLAPKGSDPVAANRPMRPLTFLRAMGCLDGRYRKIRTGGCRGFRPAVADGFAYHPHGHLAGPQVRERQGDEARIGDLGRLERVLDRIVAAGGLRIGDASPSRKRLHLWLTEFGYQTNPPDPFLGVSPARQAKFLQESAFVAWRNPRVRNITQYAWQDDAVGDRGLGAKAYSGWQSGLIDERGRAKRALATFTEPFWAEPLRDGRRAILWGQVRPGGAHDVDIQKRSPSGRWVTVGTQRTSTRGYWTRTLPLTRRAAYRFRWAGDEGGVRASDHRVVAPPGKAAGRAR